MFVHNIDSVVFSIGSFQVHWYGLTYLMGFAAAWLLALSRARKPAWGWSREEVENLITSAALGVILGARLGYCLFYDPVYFATHPLDVFKVWHGGMSFHGGAIGVTLAVLLFCRNTKRKFLDVGDFIAPLAAPGLLAGRLGNFINGELWGKVTSVPWGVVFPTGGPAPRHPSQLYEAGLEGLLLFIILWWYSSRRPARGRVSGLFLLGYGLARSFVEFFREPDEQLGYLAFGWLTMGQILCLPMILAGLALLFWPRKTENEAAATAAAPRTKSVQAAPRSKKRKKK